jgi:nucleoside-diphosphate-sugar epimerase
MNKLLVTGTSGFIGMNLISYFHENTFDILPYSREMGLEYKNITSNLINNQCVDVIIHLAGKAHDLRNTVNEKEYFEANTNLTIDIFNAFLESNARTFIYFSSVKAVKDHFDDILFEDTIPNPITAYGKSKLASEEYILKNSKNSNKNIYILRPCMIHGIGNKGNLNLLYSFVSKNIPWPLGAFNNKRSICSLENLFFVVNELITRIDIPSGIYNVSDDNPISTNQIIELIAESQNRKPLILNINKKLIWFIATIGDYFKMPLNRERLTKLTESYVVCNSKITNAIGKKLPISTIDGLLCTFYSFKK